MKTFAEYAGNFEDNFEDISSKSENFNENADEFEDIDSGRTDDFLQDLVEGEYEYEIEDEPEDEEVEYDEDDVDEALDYWERKSEARPKRQPQKEQAPKKKKKKHLSLRRKIFRGCGILILCFIIILVAVFFKLYSMLNHASESDHVNSYISESELKSSNKVTNILLLGVDAREGETSSRSDTMILVSIDRKNEKIKLTSFLRDSYVEIPGHSAGKLNSACTKGDYELVWDTIEYNFKVKIDYYMLVDFSAFENLIDALGGVDVEVTEKEATYLNNTWQKWSLTGNELHFDYGDSVHLNGEQALMFCRIRKLDSDFKRTERQRRTISAVKTSLMDAGPMELIGVANSVLPLVETDINSVALLKLGFGAITSYLSYDMESFQIPIDGTYKTNTSNYAMTFDIDETAEKLQEFIYG